jgi:hypothetical protein
MKRRRSLYARPEIRPRSHGRWPPRGMRMATPGQARLSLVHASPCPRLMRGPSRHHELFAASTRFSIVSSVGPAGRHQHRRSGRRWQRWSWSWNGPRRWMSARMRWWPASASLMLLVSVGVAGVATLEVRTYPTFTSSLETLADWLTAEGVTQVVMEATGQLLEADLVCAGRARVGAAAGQRPPRPGSCPAARPMSVMPPGCVSCWSVGCWAAASCLRRRSASCGI